MSQKVKLVPVVIGEHAKLLYKWRTDPEISRFMYSSGPKSFDEHIGWLRKISDDPSHVRFIVQQDKNPVGTAALTGICNVHQRADFEMYIGEFSARFRGVGAAAEFLILEHGFQALGLLKISCEVFVLNEAAERLHLRMGFTREGVLRRHARLDDNWVDVARLSLLKEEWNLSRQRVSEMLKGLF